MLMDVVETVEKQVMHLRNVPHEYLLFVPLIVVIFIIGMKSASRRVHAVLSIATPVAIVAYPLLTPSVAAYGHP